MAVFSALLSPFNSTRVPPACLVLITSASAFVVYSSSASALVKYPLKSKGSSGVKYSALDSSTPSSPALSYYVLFVNLWIFKEVRFSVVN